MNLTDGQKHPLIIDALSLFGGTVIQAAPDDETPAGDSLPSCHPKPNTTTREEGDPWPDELTLPDSKHTACDPADLLKELQHEKRNKKRYWGPGDVLIALVQNGIEVVLGKGAALTLFKLVSFPANKIFIRRTKLAAIADLTADMTGRHLAALQRPWRAKDDGSGPYPPLFFSERRKTKDGRWLPHLVANEAGWRALYDLVFARSASRKQTAHEHAQHVRAQRQESIARARAMRGPHGRPPED